MIRLLLDETRPRQWIKNLFVLAPLLFGRRLGDGDAVLSASLAVVCFILLSGATYIVNDVLDAPVDRLHPRKRLRPIASGRLPRSNALIAAAVLLIGGLSLAGLLGWEFLWIALAYAGLTACYSILVRQVVILDVLVIAAGFVLRVIAGAAAVQVGATHWLIVCTFVLALFLGFAKRRQELLNLPDSAGEHRTVLNHYSVKLLDQIIIVVLGVAIVSYMLYTVSPETVARFGTGATLYGTVFVIYGLLRYLVLIQDPSSSGDPAELLIRDKPLGLCLLGWVGYNVLVIYV